MNQSKKKILFAYPEMLLGGSTTSLLSLLNTLDYNQYEVDLIMYRNRGELLDYIPPAVKLLPQADKYPDETPMSRMKKATTALLNGRLLRALYSEWKYKRRFGVNLQSWAFVLAGNSRILNKEYDFAVGYLELWSNAYILNNVKAKKKLAYIHVDIENSPYIADIDCRQLSKADKIVSVSETCLEKFKKEYTSLADKGVVVENILSAQYVRSRAAQGITDFDEDFDGTKILTVCRLSVYHKGLDRAVVAMSRLASEGYNLKWYVIGEGSDRPQLEQMIKDFGLEDKFILLGQRTNPYPYFNKCDVYVMPSRYEGKPMAVTEAQILGLPVIVTRYASAEEQVRHDIDGIIEDNNDADIYYGIKRILDEPGLLDEFRANLKTRHLSNEDDVKQFYALLQ